MRHGKQVVSLISLYSANKVALGVLEVDLNPAARSSARNAAGEGRRRDAPCSRLGAVNASVAGGFNERAGRR